MPSAFTTLFCCLRISDFDTITNGFVTMTTPYARIYFTMYYILGVLLFLNILQSYFVVVFKPKSGAKELPADEDIDDEAYDNGRKSVFDVDQELEELEKLNQGGFYINLKELKNMENYVSTEISVNDNVNINNIDNNANIDDDIISSTEMSKKFIVKLPFNVKMDTRERVIVLRRLSVLAQFTKNSSITPPSSRPSTPPPSVTG